MLCELVLTVSESKRLIAKGVATMPAIKRALAEGTVAVASGSTNAYVVEELTKTPIEKTRYVLGTTIPAGVSPAGLFSHTLPYVVLKKGRAVENTTVIEAVKQMGPGDVFIKGANALHYETRRAGVLIGGPPGGTLGAVIGSIIGSHITLVIPVGLEKCVAQPIEDAHTFITADTRTRNHVTALWPVDGEIVTEIEALEILTGVEAIQSGAGGVAGAEGAVRLVARGTEAQIEQLTKLLDTIHGEPPFVSR